MGNIGQANVLLNGLGFCRESPGPGPMEIHKNSSNISARPIYSMNFYEKTMEYMGLVNTFHEFTFFSTESPGIGPESMKICRFMEYIGQAYIFHEFL